MSPADPESLSRWWQAVAPVASFLAGWRILADETHRVGAERPVTLLVAATLMGIPAWLLVDRWLRK
jgi:hypothetical protein